MFAMFRRWRVFSMPSKGAYLPSAEQSRGGAGFPHVKRFAYAYESAPRLGTIFELSEEQHDLPTVTRVFTRGQTLLRPSRESRTAVIQHTTAAVSQAIVAIP